MMDVKWVLYSFFTSDWFNIISILVLAFGFIGILYWDDMQKKMLPKETISNGNKHGAPPLINPNAMDIEIEFNGERSRMCDLDADYILEFSAGDKGWSLWLNINYVAGEADPDHPLTVYIRGQQWRII